MLWDGCVLGANTYTGATTVSAGTLQIGDGGANGGLSGVGALANNATLIFNLSSTPAQGTDFASTITGTGMLLQVGSGTLVLSGANTYTGATLVSAGTLQIGAGGVTGSLSPGSTLTNNATLAFNRSNELTQGVDFAASIGGTGVLRQAGTGALVLSGANVYTGATRIESGVLQLGNGGTTGSLSVSSAIENNAILAFKRSDTLTQGTDFAGTIGGSGQVQQVGSGSLVLGGANTYAGGTTLSAGMLNVNNAAALGTGLLTIAGGGLDNTSGGAITLSSNNPQAWMADFAFLGSNALDLGTGAVALGANRIVTVNAGTLAVGGTITGSYALTKAGSGTLELRGVNTFSGKTSVTAGTLLLSNNDALQNSAYNTNSAGVLLLGSSVTEPVFGGVTGSGDFAPGASVTKLKLSPALGVTQTYSGVLSGSLAVVKAGAGAQILTGASSYTGLTTVTGGMLKLAGAASISSSAGLSIGPGARFVFAPSSASLAAGTLNVGALSMGANSTLGVKWGKTIAVASSPNLNGPVRLNMTGAYSSNVDYTVLTAPSGLNAASYVLTGVSDFVYTVTKTATSVVIRPTLTSGLATAYWLGGVVVDDPLTWTSSNFTVDSSFNTINGTSNWRSDAAGALSTTLIPGASTEVYLTDLASAGSLSMVADADMALKGLTVTATNPVRLSDTSSSTLYLGGSGISVAVGAGSLFLGPAISLTESQTWTNSSAHEMVVGGAVDTGTSSFGLRVAGAGNMALQGAVSGSGSLTMSGGGMLTLSGANTYTGETVVSSGTLQVGAGGAEGSLNGTASITNNASLVFNQTSVYGGSMEMVISGSGSVSVWNGILTLAAANAYTGGTTLGGGQLRLAGGSDRLSTSGSITLSAGVLDLGGYSQSTSGNVLLSGGTLENGTLIGTGSAFDGQSGEISGVLAGAVGLNKTSGSTLTLGGANLYTGGTTVSMGTLALSGLDDRLSTTGALTLAGGVLDLGGRSQRTSGLVQLSGGTVENGILEATGFAYDAKSGMVSAVLAGSQALNKTTLSLLTLSGVNTYTGGTNLSAGSLLLKGGADRLSRSGSITITGGVLDLGGNLQTTLGTITFAGGTVQNGALASGGTEFLAQAGVVSAVLAGTQGLVKAGPGALTLSGVNTYAGGTTVSSGSLLLAGGDDRLSLAGAITTTGGVLDLGGNRQSTLGTITFAGGLVQNGTLTATGEAFVGQAGVVSAILAGTQGLVTAGPGALTLSARNTYTGGTTVEGGSLLLAGGDDRLSTTGFLTTTGGVLDLGGNSQTTQGTVTFAGGLVQNGTLTATGKAFVAQAGYVSAILAGTEGLVKEGAGLLTLSTVSTYTGGTTINAGSLRLAGGADRLWIAGSITTTGGVLDLGGNSQTTLGTITFAGGLVQNGTLIASGTAFVGQGGVVSAILAGTQGFVKDGAASLTLGAANVYTGGTTLNEGSLVLGGGSDRLSTGGSLLITGGVLNLGGNSQTTLGTIIFAGGLVQNGTLTSSGTGFLAQAGTVSATLAGAQGLVKAGAATLTLSGRNTYTGGTNVHSGTLLLAGGEDRLSTSGSITTTGGVLDLGGNVQTTLGTVTFAGGTVRNGTLTAAGTAFAAQAGEVAAVLAGTQGLVKEGPGSLTLSALNTYTGGTTVGAGSLQFAGGDDRLSIAGAITTTGGVLDLGGHGQTTLGTITFAGGMVQNGTLTATGTAFVAQAGAVGAILAGTQGLVKNGVDALTLSALNTFTGGTLVREGSLLLNGGDDRLSLSGAITTVGGVLDLGGNSQTTLGTVTFAGGLVQNGTLSAMGTAFVGQAGVVSAILAGTQGFVKDGLGALTLSALNTFTGGTTVREGSLILAGGDDRLSTIGSITATGGILELAGNGQTTLGTVTFAGGVIQNGTLTANGTDFVGLSGLVSATLAGTQGLVKSGTGTLTLDGRNTYTGGTTVNAGVLILAGGDERLSISGNLTAAGGDLDLGGNAQSTSGLVTFAGGLVKGGTLLSTGTAFVAQSGTVSATLGGVLGLHKNGDGAFTLSGINTYSGGTTLQTGRLNLNTSGDALGSAIGTGRLTINGGTLANTSGSKVTIATDNQQLWNGDFAFAAGSELDLGAGSVTLGGSLTVTIEAGTLSVGGGIAGSGFGLIKNGEGRLTLSAVSTFDGGMTVRAGSLQLVGGDDRLSLGGSITTLGGVLDLGGNGQTTLGKITFAGGVVQNGTLTATGTAFVAQAGTVGAILAGTQGLVKEGAGSLTLSALNTYSGGTTVSAGSLQFAGGDDRLSIAGAITTTGGVLDLGGHGQTTLGPITFAGGAVQNGILTATGNVFVAQAGVVSAVLAGTQGLVKEGPGALILSAPNTYTGGTTVSAGLLQLVGGDDRLWLAGAITTTGGVLDLGGNGQTTLGPITFAGGAVQNGILTATGTVFVAQAGVVNAVLAGTQGLVKDGADALTLSALNTYTGGTTVEGGSLQLAGGDDRLSLAGSITARGGVLDLGGNGQTTLGMVTFAGGTVQNGTLTATGTVFVGQAGWVSAVLAGTQGLAQEGPGALTLNGQNTYTGGTTVEGGSLQLAGGDDRLALAGSITARGGVLDLGGNGQTTLGTVTFAGGTVQNGTLTATGTVFVGQAGWVSAVLAGTQALVKEGPGALTLNGQNTYTGGTTVSADLLQLAGGDDRLSLVGPITATGGVLDLGGNGQTTLGPITFAGGAVQNGTLTATGTAFVGQAGWVSAVLAGTQGLVKDGPDSLTLSALNTHTGGTTVNAGSLQLAGGDDRLSVAGWITTMGGVLDLGGNGQTTLGTVTFAGGTVQNGMLTASGTAFVAQAGWVSAVLAGTQGLVKDGLGSLILSSLNTYTGGTTVRGGSLQLAGGDDRLSVAGSITTRGGVLDLGGNGQTTLGTITFAGGTVQNGILTPTGTAFIGREGLVAAVLAGAQGLAKTTGGALTLSAANTFGGGVTLEEGLLNLNVSGTSLGSSLGLGILTINGGNLGNSSGANVRLATNNGQLWNGDFSFVGGSDLNMGTGPVVLGRSLTVTISSGSLSVGGVIAGSGFALTKSGGQALVLSASNTYDGGTNLIAGLLMLSGGSDRLSPYGPITLTGGVLDLGGNSQGTAGPVTFAGGTVQGGTLLAKAGPFIAEAGAANAVLAGTQGLVKNGTGTFSLNGANPFTGPVRINAGTLALSGGAALHDTIVATIGGNGTLLLHADETIAALSGSGLLSLQSYKLATDSSENSSFNGALGGSGVLEKLGSGILTLGGSSPGFNGILRVSGGTVTLDGGSPVGKGAVEVSALGTLSLTSSGSLSAISGAGNVLLAGATLTLGGSQNVTLTGAISGVGAVLKAGSGELTLTHANTFSGGFTLESGAVRLGNSAALGSGTVYLFGGTLSGDDAIHERTISNWVIARGSSVLGDLVQSAALSLSGTVSLSGSVEWKVQSPVLIANGVTAADSLGLTKTGGSTLTLGGSST